jgi:hypothetical protein
MGEVITIGLDIAKSVFQAHGVDEAGAVVIRKRVSRAKLLEFFASLKPCLVGIEACPAAHHWSRELIELGHEVKLMPPAYVKTYVRRRIENRNPTFSGAPCGLWRLPSASSLHLMGERRPPNLWRASGRNVTQAVFAGFSRIFGNVLGIYRPIFATGWTAPFVLPARPWATSEPCGVG